MRNCIQKFRKVQKSTEKFVHKTSYTGWPQVWVKKFKDFSRTFKYVFKTYFGNVLLRCRLIKSNRINFVLLTIVTTQQVM